MAATGKRDEVEETDSTGGVGVTGSTAGVGVTGNTGGVGVTGNADGVGVTDSTSGVGVTGNTGGVGFISVFKKSGAGLAVDVCVEGDATESEDSFSDTDVKLSEVVIAGVAIYRSESSRVWPNKF